MADKPPKKEPVPSETSPAPDDAATPRSASGLLTMLKAIAFIAIIVVVEVVAASMFIPSAQDTEKIARQYVAATAGDSAPTASAEEDGHGKGKSDQNVTEVELGTFNITRFNPASNTTLSIDFELYGIVLAAEEAELKELLGKNKIRVREQVILTLHAAESKDLSDAGLGLIKRQILEKTNRALGQPLLKEVLFSKFNFVER